MQGRPLLTREAAPELAAVDPLVALALCPDDAAFYWCNEESGAMVAGLGSAYEIRGAGWSRFADALSRWRTVRSSLDGPVEHVPLLVGGFAFFEETSGDEWKEFPPLRFFVPRVVWNRDEQGTHAYRTWRFGEEAITKRLGEELLDLAQGVPSSGLVGSGAQFSDSNSSLSSSGHAPDDESRSVSEWRSRVEAVREEIAAGRLQKAVISRHRKISGRSPSQAVQVVRELAASRPQCWSFLVRFGATSFLGSTPERLVRVSGRSLETEAVAGSRPRGTSGGEDRRLAEELLASSKERGEHALVVDHLRKVLGSLTDKLEVAPTPSVMRLSEAMHLRTLVQGELAQPVCALQAAARLHPTPAVCGTPTDVALARIAAGEARRGWYTGAVGWMDESGDGEMAVALRSALVSQAETRTWAGAGIVEGSEPDAELAEVEAKMTAMLERLEPDCDDRAA